MDCDDTEEAQDAMRILAHTSDVQIATPAGCFPPGSALPPASS
jgi:hypothetical protein